MFRLVTLGGLFAHPVQNPQSRLVSQRRRLAVLALLAAAAERGLTRDKLLGYLWPETDEERGRRLLNQAVYGLRQDLAPEVVVGTTDLRLDPEVIATDLGDFRAALSAGRLEEAVAAYRGPFLDGFYLPGVSEFDRWVEDERGALARQYGEVLERLARTADQGSRAALGWWRKLAAHDPLSSTAALGLMRAYAATGDREGALQHARVHESLVREELGVPPAREVTEFAQALRDQTAAVGVVPTSAPRPAPTAPSDSAISAVEPAAAGEEPDDLDSVLAAALAPDFRLGQKLSSGPIHVFIAEDVDLGRRVLVKALSRHLAYGLSAERFERGIRLAAQLQHPHILPVLSAGRAGGWPYYVTPYVQGESLAARLVREGGTIPLADAARILRDVASALAYAHRRGVIHRDITPDHVLLSGDDALIADFGVAKAVLDSARGESPIMSVGLAIGTPGYMAPEQALGDPATDHRADLYAFGVLAYEMLSGRPRAGGASALPATLPQGTPAPLAALVMRCLAQRPAERPQSADEILRTLEGVAVEPSLSDGTALRRRLLLFGVCVVLLAVGAALLLLR